MQTCWCIARCTVHLLCSAVSSVVNAERFSPEPPANQPYLFDLRCHRLLTVSEPSVASRNQICFFFMTPAVAPILFWKVSAVRYLPADEMRPNDQSSSYAAMLRCSGRTW